VFRKIEFIEADEEDVGGASGSSWVNWSDFHSRIRVFHTLVLCGLHYGSCR
jgi:hypothetical protein